MAQDETLSNELEQDRQNLINGYRINPHVEAFSTDPILDEAPRVYPTVQMQANNLAVAIGIVGMQVAKGRFHINFEDPLWHLNFEGRALEIAEFLNMLQVPS